jgi:hypothetical protein
MAQAVAKYAAKKMMAGEMAKYKNKSVDSPYDPYYEMIEHPRKPGKFKKVKKQIPAYIPEHDADILARARKSAYRLDFCLFNLLGFRFGWSSVIGLVPAVGDAADMALAANLIRRMQKCKGGLPSGILIRMFINLLIDFLVGLVPIVGDLADAAVKCNSKNVRLFEKHLDETYKPKELLERDHRSGRSLKDQRPATVYEDFSDEDMERVNGGSGSFDDTRRADVREPGAAYNGRGNGRRIPDEEMGIPREQQQTGTVRGGGRR